MKKPANISLGWRAQGCGALGSARSPARRWVDGRTKNMDLERLRRSYRPLRIGVLFIGESPPERGSFFYDVDSDSRLLRHTARAFEYPLDSPLAKAAFLKRFKLAGCYLDDLCLDPVNHLNRVARRHARQGASSSLRERIALATPLSVICVMKSIEKLVRKAVEEAGLSNIPFDGVPFPAMGHETRYVEALSHILRRRGILGV